MNDPEKNIPLTAFWITFPDDANSPMGIGVTAFSDVDAFKLMEASGLDWHLRAKRVELRVVEKPADVGLRHVTEGAGSIVVRGVWYPCHNVGFGAP